MLKLHGSGESGTKSRKDKGDKHGDKEKGNRPCGSDSKTDSKGASQEEIQKSLHHSSCLAVSSTVSGSQEDVGKAPRSHQSHKKSKKHGKSSHKKSHH